MVGRMLPDQAGNAENAVAVVFPSEHLLSFGPLGYVTQEDGRPLRRTLV